MYFINLVLMFSGLILGSVLAFFTKEELKPGEVYFLWLKRIMLVLIALVFITKLTLNIPLIIFGIILGYIFQEKYLYLGAAALRPDFLVTSLVFIFGLPNGTLIMYNRKKEIRKIIKNGVLFFVAGTIFLFYNQPVFLQIAAGSLITQALLVKKVL